MLPVATHVLQNHRASLGQCPHPKPGLGTERSQLGLTGTRPPLLPWVYLGSLPLAIRGVEQG